MDKKILSGVMSAFVILSKRRQENKNSISRPNIARLSTLLGQLSSKEDAEQKQQHANSHEQKEKELCDGCRSTRDSREPKESRHQSDH